MGAIQRAMNRPFWGSCVGWPRFPGLPSVALGYDWLARFAGCQAGPPVTLRDRITFGELTTPPAASSSPASPTAAKSMATDPPPPSRQL